MSNHEVNAFLDWLYIFGFFIAVGVIAIVLMMVISLVVYLKTGVHMKDWIDDKFSE